MSVHHEILPELNLEREAHVQFEELREKLDRQIEGSPFGVVDIAAEQAWQELQIPGLPPLHAYTSCIAEIIFTGGTNEYKDTPAEAMTAAYNGLFFAHRVGKILVGIQTIMPDTSWLLIADQDEQRDRIWSISQDYLETRPALDHIIQAYSLDLDRTALYPQIVGAAAALTFIGIEDLLARKQQQYSDYKIALEGIESSLRLYESGDLELKDIL